MKTTDNKYHKEGALWRIWDFHIHTPVSYEWKGKKLNSATAEEKKAILEEVILGMNESEASVFVIQDYWTFDGYHALREYLSENKAIEFKKRILPGIELRLQSPTDYRLNVHGIFSEELSKQQLEDFKSKLKIVGLNRNLSDEAIQEYARTKVNAAIAREHGAQNLDLSIPGNAFNLGCKIVEITLDSFSQAFKELPSDTGIIMMPWDTYNGLSDMDCMKHFASAREYFACPHIFETRNSGYIDAFNGRGTEENARYFSAFQEFLNDESRLAVSGSDAHKVSDYGTAHNGKYTWIKAEPCFNGLLQAVREPIDRSFIGVKPQKLVAIEENPSEFIRSIKINKSSGSNVSDNWFDSTNLLLNKDLVAIIGNKGSGKSALADIIALVGNSSAHKYFSFLKDKRFRDAKKKWADDFFAIGTWEDNESTSEICLAHNPLSSSVQRIKYIPQVYFEELCSTDNQESTDRFEEELKQVIFSHVDDSNRQKHDSLDSLLHDRETKIRSAILDLKSQLSVVNSDIVELESQQTPENREKTEEKIRFKKSQLKTHDSLKPQVVEEPSSELNADQIVTLTNHQALETKIDKDQSRLKELESNRGILTIKLNAIERLIQTLEQLNKYIDSQKNSVSDDLLKAEVDWEQLVIFDTKRDSLTNAVDLVNSELERIAIEESNLSESIETDKKLSKAFSEQLDEPNKKYHAYLNSLKEWREKRENIVGDDSKVESLVFLESHLKLLDGIPGKLALLDIKRLDLAKEIFEKLLSIQTIRKSMYKPVQTIIDKHELMGDEFELNFESAMSISNFSFLFFERIKKTTGTFSGEKEGPEQLEKFINESDFETTIGVSNFLQGIMDRLRFDHRTDKKNPIDISKQLLKQGHKLNELYDFIFGLSYIEPKYSLLLSGTPVEKLSPGQRGALLLIFYLLVDRETCPIVLDQPEENLDNQTVYSLLVPVIKEAKKRRQVIMVTHNANLAVTCDAEQIIYSSFNRIDENRIKYFSGSIENPEINNLVLDILEGTKPAFKNRQLKYRRSIGDIQT